MIIEKQLQVIIFLILSHSICLKILFKKIIIIKPPCVFYYAKERVFL